MQALRQTLPKKGEFIMITGPRESTMRWGFSEHAQKEGVDQL